MLSCFFFNDTATTEIYTLSLHDALPIYLLRAGLREPSLWLGALARVQGAGATSLLPERHLGLVAAHELDDALQRLDVADRKSTRLNSSHLVISYAVFCLKKKIKTS